MQANGRTAFVFAGGGSLGAVQVGMLHSLVEDGMRADFAVGSSVGAINAAHFAGDPTLDGVLRLEKIWRELRRADVFPVSMFDAVRAITSRRNFLVRPDPLAKLLERHIGFERLEQARMPCHIITTDLLQGCEVRLSDGPVVPALLASAAIPGVFPPVEHEGRFLVDGGAANHTPVTAALELGASRIIVLPTGYSCALTDPPQGAIAIALQGLNILIVRKLVADVQRLRNEADIVVVPPLCPVGTSPYDFSSCDSLISRAMLQTKDWLLHGVEMVDGVPHQLPAHVH